MEELELLYLEVCRKWRTVKLLRFDKNSNLFFVIYGTLIVKGGVSSFGVLVHLYELKDLRLRIFPFLKSATL